MENQICPLHDVSMEAKEGAYGTYHSHILPNVGFCNGKKITPFKNKLTGSPQPAQTPEFAREPIKQRDFDAENRGKVRHGIVVALIENSGSAALKAVAEDQTTRKAINIVTEYVMNGEEL